MADCRISCITDSKANTTDDTTPAVPEGKVGKVCKEWLVREDGVLAYRLQTEEISQHYEGNRNKNRTVREDLPLARGLQRSEEEEATAVRMSYERILQDQLDEDERVAREIHDRLREQEQNQRRAEEEDERLAKKLAEKERARLQRKRQERERQQVERLSAQLKPTGATNGADTQEMVGAVAQSVDDLRIRDRHSATFASDDELDLSEFCLQPPPDLTQEELRIFLEEQDAEIARLLQQQELKRKSTVDKEKLAQIEAQDYEIARLLQKQEKERLRRLKERAKQKQMQKQLSSNPTNNAIIASHSAVYSRHSSDNFSDNSTSSQRQPTNGFHSGVERSGHQWSDPDSIMYEEIGHQSYHTNIAAYLDPTFKRNSTVVLPPNPLLNPNPSPVPRNSCPPTHNLESNVDDTDEPGLHFAQVYKVSPTPSPSDSPHSTSHRPANRPMLRDPEPIAEDNYYPIEENSRRRERVSPTSPVLPYIPVQGQRRVSSMEKKRKSKENNCKTQ